MLISLLLPSLHALDWWEERQRYLKSLSVLCVLNQWFKVTAFFTALKDTQILCEHFQKGNKVLKITFLCFAHPGFTLKLDDIWFSGEFLSSQRHFYSCDTCIERLEKTWLVFNIFRCFQNEKKKHKEKQICALNLWFSSNILLLKAAVYTERERNIWPLSVHRNPSPLVESSFSKRPEKFKDCTYRRYQSFLRAV